MLPAVCLKWTVVHVTLNVGWPPPPLPHRGLEKSKRFRNLRVKKDELLENIECHLDPK